MFFDFLTDEQKEQFLEERTALLKEKLESIREKIEKDPKAAEYVLTKWGVGYFFKEN